MNFFFVVVKGTKKNVDDDEIKKQSAFNNRPFQPAADAIDRLHKLWQMEFWEHTFTQAFHAIYDDDRNLIYFHFGDIFWTFFPLKSALYPKHTFVLLTSTITTQY